MKEELVSTAEHYPDRDECIEWATYWIERGHTLSIDLIGSMQSIFGIDDAEGFANYAETCWLWIARNHD